MREAGDYAVRGGILDLFAPGMDEPVRLDFFGDTLESIRVFDPETQRTTAELRALDLVPMAEFQLTSDTIRLFRTGYVAAFGAAAPDDVLYEAVSEGRRDAGMEHWLPLFHKQMETLFDYLDAPSSPSPHGGEGRVRGYRPLGQSPLTLTLSPLGRGDALRLRQHADRLETLAEEAAHERLAQIADYYEARNGRSISPAAARPISRCRRSGFISPKPNGASASTHQRWRGCRRSRRRKARRTPSRSARTPARISRPSAASPTPMCSRR